MFGTTLLSIKTTGEKKSNYKSKVIGMTLERQSPAKLGGERFSGGDDEGIKGTNLLSVNIQAGCFTMKLL